MSLPEEDKEWSKLMLEYQKRELDHKLRRAIEIVVLLLIALAGLVFIFDK